MVQKEVGERLAARAGRRRSTASRRCSPSSPATCEVARPVSRTVFLPVPNVDSVLVRPRAHGPGAAARRCGALVRAAFAHRRKALPRSLELAGGVPGPDVRDARARGARGDRPPRRRARRAPDARGVPRAARRRSRRERARRATRPAKVNLCLTLGPTRADGRHELVTVMQPVDLCDRVRLVPAELGATPTRCSAPGSRATTSPRAALRAFRERDRLGRRARAAADREADPGRRRHGRRLGGRGRRAAARRPRRRRSRDDALLREIAADARAPTSPRRCARGATSPRGAGEVLHALPDPAPFGVLVVPLAPPARDRRRVPRGGPPAAPARPARRSQARSADLAAALAAGAPLAPGDLLLNDLEPAAVLARARARVDARRRARRRRRPRARVRLGPDGRRAVRRRRARAVGRRRRSAGATRARSPSSRGTRRCVPEACREDLAVRRRARARRRARPPPAAPRAAAAGRRRAHRRRCSASTAAASSSCRTSTSC